MSTLLQISDTHFGTEQPRVVQAVMRLIKTRAPDLVVLSGDITQRATRAQFAAAKAFLDRLGSTPRLVIPGNHDIPLFQLGARLFTPYGRFIEALGDALEPVLETPEWLVIGVNTTRWYRHKDGEVSHEQIERVAQRLSRADPRQLRLVVTHQPVIASRDEDLTNVLHRREAATVRWAATGADLVLGGHIHLPYVRPVHRLFADCPRPLWGVQAGTAFSRRVRDGAPNSVNLIRHEITDAARHCSVERWDYRAADDAFSCVDTHPLPLGAGHALEPAAAVSPSNQSQAGQSHAG